MAKSRFPTPQQVGRAGELFVAAELNKRGALATLYLTNTPGVDVVARSPYRPKTVSIQVKTKGPRSKVWQGNIDRIRDDADAAAETDFIIFVDLGAEDMRPDYFVLPLGEFSAKHFRQHERWLESQRDRSRPRNPNSTHTSITASEVESGKGEWNILGVIPEGQSE